MDLLDESSSADNSATRFISVGRWPDSRLESDSMGEPYRESIDSNTRRLTATNVSTSLEGHLAGDIDDVWQPTIDELSIGSDGNTFSCFLYPTR